MSQGNEKLGFSSPNLIRYLFIYIFGLRDIIEGEAEKERKEEEVYYI